MPSNPAPGDLERVRAFVNTFDAEVGTEAFASPRALRDWLAGERLLSATARVTQTDVEQAIELREALRAVLLHHDGEPLEPRAPAVIAQAASRAGLGVAFDDHARAQVTPTAKGVDGALGALLAIIAAAQRDGTWERLKVCPADDCLWAFYDRSKNRSARWCDARECGNRAKVRAFRERQRSRA